MKLIKIDNYYKLLENEIDMHTLNQSSIEIICNSDKYTPSNEHIDETYVYNSIPVGVIRKSMGFKNIDISNDVTITEETNYEMYTPKNYNKIAVYIHGGGFIGGDIDTVRNFCKKYAEVCKSIVYNIAYPLAPENMYPSALNYVSDFINSKILKHPEYDFSILGDSAGGNLAICSTIKLVKNGIKNIKYCIPLYPVVYLGTRDLKFKLANYKIDSNHELCTQMLTMLKGSNEMLRVCLGNTDYEDILISPLNINYKIGDVKFINIAAEFDYLNHELHLFSKVLEQNNQDVVTIEVAGCEHAFIDKIGIYKQASNIIYTIKEFL